MKTGKSRKLARNMTLLVFGKVGIWLYFLPSGHSEIRFWNTRDVKAVLEGSKEARTQVKGSTRKKKLTGKDRKTTFYSGFGENLDEKIELKDQENSSDEDEKSEEENENDEKENENDEKEKEKKEIENEGPKSSDSLSDDDLEPPEPSTSELESDHKPMKRPPQPSQSNSKKKRRKKSFKPLL